MDEAGQHAVDADVQRPQLQRRGLREGGRTTKQTWALARELLLENAAYWEDSDPEFAEARTRLFHREPALYRRYLVHCDDIERILTQAFAAATDRRAQLEIAKFVIAAAAVGAWRAGFAKWLAEGGRLAAHIAAGLELVAPVTRR